MPNNPIPDAELAELRRLHEDARSVELAITRDFDDGCALVDERGVCMATTQFLADARWIKAIYKSFSPVLARLEAVEREREQCPHCQNTGTAISSNAAGDEYTMRCCCDAGVKRDKDRLVRELDVLMCGIEGAAKQASLCDLVAYFPKWLADRDAQQRREGAAEYLEAAAEKRWTLSYIVMREEAKRLREGK